MKQGKIHEMQKISVIVPAYNVEKTIEKCLDSIISQSYQNIEIIVVNDGSTDSTGKILAEYSTKDARIKVIKHDENRGLFLARMTGIKAASGDYIGFVDSDDYISKDNYRSLLEGARKENADIVVGKLVQEDESGYQWVQNIYEDYDFGQLLGDEIWQSYWKQEGQCFIWHTVWNKLYSAKLWEKALPDLEKQKEHLIMCEDFVFSTVLFYYAKKLSSVKYARYFYYRNSNASTALDNNFRKFEKNVKDLIHAFNYVKAFLTDKKTSKEILAHYNRWEGLYRFFWTNNIINSSLADRSKTILLKRLNSALTSNEIPSDPEYFYTVSTAYDRRYEDIVNWILKESTKVVSFDIFDTALIRPFYQPTDLLEGLNEIFLKECPNVSISFSKVRIEAERVLRKEKIYISRTAEDISLEEIYHKIGEIFGISKEVLKTMKEAELSLEEKYLQKRKSIYNLYQIAVCAQKKVIFISDMYMDSKTLKHILKKNGYNKIDGLYISAEQGLSKRTGSIYRKVLEQFAMKGDNLIHIGDNWESDVMKARENQIIALFYPGTLDCLEGKISDIKTTHALGGYEGRNNSLINWEKGLAFMGNRCAIAVAANELYDMPFVSYNEWTEMNASPQFMGYFSLGMHLLGFAKWLAEESAQRDYQKLVFIARDGYLPMQAYEVYERYSHKGVLKTDYFYTSRKAAVPCGLEKAEDMYSLYDCLNTDKLFGKDILMLLAPVLDEARLPKVSKEKLQTKIDSFEAYAVFVKQVLEPLFDKKKNAAFQEKVAAYFREVFEEKTALVDIGYSGRTQEMIYRTAQVRTDGFFVHKNEDACLKREDKLGVEIRTFYDFTPSITGAQRELLYSSLEPSCIGYEMTESGINPRFEQVDLEYPQFYLVSEMQKSALSFVKNFCRIFEDNLDGMYMRNLEISYPFEHSMAYIEDADLKMFDCILFEDDMWAGAAIPLSKQWKRDISYHKLLAEHKPKEIQFVERNFTEPNHGVNYAWELYHHKGMEKKSFVAKMIFWLINDRVFLKERWKAHMSDIRKKRN